MARMVATKAALSIRVDALTDADGKSEPQAPSIGLENRAKLESRLRALEYQNDGTGVKRFQNGPKKQPRFEMKGETQTYNTAADAVDLVPTQRDPLEVAVKVVLDMKEEKKREKEERRAKKRAEKAKSMEVDEADAMTVDNAEGKKRKRRDSETIGGARLVGVGSVQLFVPISFTD
jgi:nucleolar protein 58